MKLSPGIPFLIRYILVCCAPPLAVYCTKRVLSATSDVALPAWFWVVTAILSGPLLYSLHVWRKFRGFRLRAAALGAVMPTELNGDEFGNKDVLRGILEAFITGYPCEYPITTGE